MSAEKGERGSEITYDYITYEVSIQSVWLAKLLGNTSPQMKLIFLDISATSSCLHHPNPNPNPNPNPAWLAIPYFLPTTIIIAAGRK